MKTQYPELRKAENRRVNLLIFPVFIPLLCAIAGWLILSSGWGALYGFIFGCLVAYIAIKLIYKYSKVVCPICGSEHIKDNYVNSPRFQNKNIEHSCESCGSSFIDGTLIGKNT